MAEDFEFAPSFTHRLLTDLDSDQRHAVASFGPKTLVVAGAGSGKTRVLTYGLASLLEEHELAEEEILLLTFTRKAAAQMRERAQNVLGRPLDTLHCGTFHAVGATILRDHAQIEFTLLDEREAMLLLYDTAQDIIDEDTPGLPSGERLLELFSLFTEQGDVEAVLKQLHPNLLSLRRLLEELYDEYQNRKQAQNLFDYADILKTFYDWLETASYAKTLKAVLVDEAQDLNYIQRQIVERLTAGGAWRVMVGDGAQSIYGFRLADYNAFYQMAEEDDTTVVKLPVNYRSTADIVGIANILLPSTNVGMLPTAFREHSIPPLLLDPASEEVEEELIREWASKLLDNGAKPEDLAVLARQHNHLLSARRALAGLCSIADLGKGVSKNMEVAQSGLTALMRLATDKHSRLGYSRLLEMLGLSEEERRLWLQTLPDRPNPFEDLAARINHPIFDELLAALDEPASKGLWAKLLHGPYGMLLADLETDMSARAGMILALDDSVSDLDVVGQKFVDEVVGLSIADFDTGEGVRLGTIHASKGLEFPHVFVVRASVGAFPSAYVERQHLAEEKRLLYVAFTRAEETLTVSRARWLRERFHVKADYDFFADKELREAFVHEEHLTAFELSDEENAKHSSDPLEELNKQINRIRRK